MQVYYVTCMAHVIAFEAAQSRQGTFEPMTPVPLDCQRHEMSYTKVPYCVNVAVILPIISWIYDGIFYYFLYTSN